MNQVEINKKNVVEFFQQIINEKNFSAAQTYLGNYYIQHHPFVADGFEGLKQAIEYLRDNFPQAKAEIKQVLAEGDHVVLHVHLIKEHGTRGSALADFFRLEDGKIVEHWYVGQDIPESLPHSNGVF